jgi:hypothetical protein
VAHLWLAVLPQTIAEREALEKQEEAAEEEHKQRLNERQVGHSSSSSNSSVSGATSTPACILLLLGPGLHAGATASSSSLPICMLIVSSSELVCVATCIMFFLLGFMRSMFELHPHLHTACSCVDSSPLICLVLLLLLLLRFLSLPPRFCLQQETRQLLVQVIAADEAAARAAAAPVALKEYEEIDTGDEAEPDAIEQWQRREAARIRCAACGMARSVLVLRCRRVARQWQLLYNSRCRGCSNAHCFQERHSCPVCST